MVNQEREFDIVLYGASGFTGAYVLEQFFSSEYAQKYKLAVAGRSEAKLKKTLEDVGNFVGSDLSAVPIILADSSSPEQLDAMAKRTKVIINVVGPYRLYGEPVVKAAVENGTAHVDISGEPAFLEKMQLLFDEKAKESGALIVGAAGWDSIPVDVGVTYLEKHFPGTIAYVETFASFKNPPEYAINNGTYQTILLALSGKDNLGETRRKLMPEKLEKFKPTKRSLIWYNDELKSSVMPFPGSDKSVVNRSQYYEAVNNKKHPISIETYVLQPSTFKSVLVILWFGLLSLLCKCGPILKFCQNNPDLVSFGKFSAAGPKREYVKKAKFTTYVKGYGWKDSAKPEPDVEPTETLTIRVDGPDAGYLGTAGFVLSSALTILEDNLPVSGVMTTAVAFKDSKLLDRLAKFDITFKRDNHEKSDIKHEEEKKNE